MTHDRIVIERKAFWRIRPGQEPEKITTGGWIATAIDKAERMQAKRENGRGA